MNIKGKKQVKSDPDYFVNGYQLPDNYKIEDLKFVTEFNVNVK